MLGQYRLMRRHAIGSFAEMLQEMSKDPAMMVWLDTRGSKKGNPNENYARELMELFSLGIGNYTEMDIREAARAFTGWDIKGTEVGFNAKEHDDGEKTVLSKTGKFKGEDIVRICLDQPACPQFIITKFFRFMVSETVPATPELIEPLAAKFKASGYDFGVVVKTVLHSNLFFSPQVYRTPSSRRSISASASSTPWKAVCSPNATPARRNSPSNWTSWARTSSARRP